jgi:hypothetical protein
MVGVPFGAMPLAECGVRRRPEQPRVPRLRAGKAEGSDSLTDSKKELDILEAVDFNHENRPPIAFSLNHPFRNV